MLLKTMTHRAIIIGGGPAGLTAAYELLQKTDITPVVIEKSDNVGGISRTVNYKGNRLDIGGHRFFSKSERVMDWWLSILPLESHSGPEIRDPEKIDKVMLLRNRRSRIYCFRKFFDYPVSLNAKTIASLGLARTARIALSYMKSVLFTIRGEKNLEEFFINRFGRELYLTFFKSYTEKVWGMPCNKISAEWGAQRVKGLSIWKTIAHVLRRLGRHGDGLPDKGTETSLIEQFLYPKYGPGQMWEEVASRIRSRGGEIVTNHEVVKIHTDGFRVKAVTAQSKSNGAARRFEGDYFFSTMPVRDLIGGMEPLAPEMVAEIAGGLIYRDFITVGLLLNRLKIKAEKGQRLIKDNWIYIQEPDVDVGRLQFFNNWSPYMVADHSKVWLGLEYFCYDSDAIWKKSDEEMIHQATMELDRIGIIDKKDAIDGTIIHMPKTYPAYFGTYNRFSEIRGYLDRFENLFLIGRNGMHRYNNQDHSMLSAMISVENIITGRKDRENIWGINVEREYHENR